MEYTMMVNNLKVKHGISTLAFIVVIISLSGCNESAVKRDPIAPPVSDAFQPDGHILAKRKVEDVVHQGASIPSTVNSRKPILPRLYSKPTSNYSLTAVNVPVSELLFQIAKDAGKQIDIYSGLKGFATINALNQPLDRILERLSDQSGFIYVMQGNTIVIKPDVPEWRNYNVDYVNINKTSEDAIQMKMNVSAGGAAATGQGGSSTKVSVKSEHNFWGRLEDNITLLAQLDPYSLASTTPLANATITGLSKNTVINPEAGVISVYTTNKKHKAIQQYIKDVSIRADRQVLIEATVVEVILNDTYQAGIDWSLINREGLGFTLGRTIDEPKTGLSIGTFNAAGTVGAIASGGLNMLAKLDLLKQFGDSKVLSSPKIMAINNQTALLKVVENEVYFTVDVNTTPATTAGGVATTTYQTEVHTVPVGFTMSVTPFVSANGDVTLNVRPTISRVLRYEQDPNPELNIASGIPVIQEKEMSSVLKLKDRQTAIIGGLIEDQNSNSRDGVPWLSDIPIMGDLFSSRSDATKKTELVIFIRPVIIKNPDVDNGDLQQVGRFLKTSNY